MAFTSRLFFFSRIIFFLFKYRGALLASCTGSLPTTNHLWCSPSPSAIWWIQRWSPTIFGGSKAAGTLFRWCSPSPTTSDHQPPMVDWCSPKAIPEVVGDTVHQIAFGFHQRWSPKVVGGWWWRSRPPVHQRWLVVGGRARRYSSDQRCR